MKKTILIVAMCCISLLTYSQNRYTELFAAGERAFDKTNESIAFKKRLAERARQGREKFMYIYSEKLEEFKPQKLNIMSWTRLEDDLPSTADGDILWYDEKDGTVALESYNTFSPDFYTKAFTHWMYIPELPKK